jgi:anti-anti-sigma factor
MQPSATAPVFSCDVHPDRERVIVRLAGELDLGVAPRVEATVQELIDAGFTAVVIDLRELRFMDSTGLRMLVAAQRLAEERSCALSLIRGPQEVHRVFEITATETLFAFDGAGLVC